jgi:hypothetical protein
MTLWNFLKLIHDARNDKHKISHLLFFTAVFINIMGFPVFKIDFKKWKTFANPEDPK